MSANNIQEKTVGKTKGFFSVQTAVPLFFVCIAFFSLLFLMGCTDVPGPPFTFSQYAKYVKEVGGGDFNFVAYYAGDYNGLCLARVDWNVLQMYDCNSVGGVGDVNWSSITGLPLSCPAGQAVQVLDDVLTCVSVGGTDTNWQTSWATFDANMKNQYRKYSIDLNTSNNINSDANISANGSGTFKTLNLITSTVTGFAINGGVALGIRNIASGVGATALGLDNNASGAGSFVSGDLSSVSGLQSFGSGEYVNVSGNYSGAIGDIVTASGTSSMAFGSASTASGTHAITIGSGLTSSGASDSIAIGNSFTNSVSSSIALGSGQKGFSVEPSTVKSFLPFVASSDVNSVRFCFTGGNCVTNWASVSSTDTNIFTAGIMRADNNSFLIDVNAGIKNLRTDVNAYVAGRLGIGTTTPAQKLDVNGNSYFRGDVNATGVLRSDLNKLCAGNYCYNINDLNASGGGGGGETLAQTLALGNVTSGNDISFDTNGDVISDATNTSIDPYNRKLYGPDGVSNKMDWSGTFNNDIPISFQNDDLILSASDGTQAFSIGAYDNEIQITQPVNLDAANIVFDSSSVITDGHNGKTSIDPYNRTLYGSDGTSVRYDWENNQLNDSSAVLGIDLYNRILYATDGTDESIDWSGTPDQMNPAISFDSSGNIYFSPRYLYFPQNAYLSDGSNNSIDVYDRQLFNGNGTSVFDWDGSGTGIGLSIQTNGEAKFYSELQDSSGNKWFDASSNRYLTDASENPLISLADNGNGAYLYYNSGDSRWHFTKDIDTTIQTIYGAWADFSSVEADAYSVGGTGGVTNTYDDGVDTQISFTSGLATAISTAYDETLMSNKKYIGTNDPKAELVPISFTWNANGLKQFGDPSTVTGKTQYGYSAQDVNKFYSECVIKTFLKEMQDINKTIDYNVIQKTEVELKDAFEKISVPIMKDVNKTEYYLDYDAMNLGADAELILKTRIIIVQEPTDKTKTITRLKDGVVFDEDTGVFWKNETTLQQRTITTRTQIKTNIPVITYNKNCVNAKLAGGV